MAGLLVQTSPAFEFVVGATTVIIVIFSVVEVTRFDGRVWIDEQEESYVALASLSGWFAS